LTRDKKLLLPGSGPVRIIVCSPQEKREGTTTRHISFREYNACWEKASGCGTAVVLLKGGRGSATDKPLDYTTPPAFKRRGRVRGAGVLNKPR